MTTFSDTTVNPVIVSAGKTVTPFSLVTATDPLQTTENVSVTLNSYYYYYPYYNQTPVGLGTLTDPMGGGSFDPATNTFTESAVVTGTPTAATQILNRLVYTPPALSNGSNASTRASISVNGTADPTSDVIETVTPPGLSGTVADEPVASGDTIRPFATTQVSDSNFFYNTKTTATITLTDGGGPTDADGLLTGPGLGKTGVGTYAIPAASYYSLQSYLQQLSFAPVAVAPGATRTTAFELNVTDTGAALSTDDKTTSVLVIGPIPGPPLIAGTSDSQTVAPGNAISPFNGVTISDPSASPLDSATLTVSGGGTLSGAGLVPGATGVYTVAAVSPSALTSILNKVTFTPPPLGGQPSATSGITLAVADAGQTATDSKTTVTEVAPVPITSAQAPAPPSDFTVADQTTGQQTSVNGDAYTGPVAGIAKDLILITPDNLNITANTPNVFIHSGSGTDALDVSKVNGTNILDGSTGSNFLTGGTGADTFYLDDRNPTSDVFSTIVNFHAGDNASVFGVNPTDFKVTTLDNQGAANAKGLDYAFTAPGHANANFVIAGYSTADLSNGRLTVTYGTTPDTPGVPGSQYLNIHAN